MKDNSQQGNSTKYVTSSRAAQLSGYSQDYVGQLCRGASVGCRRISGEWHVALESLLAYKERFSPEKDVSLQKSDPEKVLETENGHTETFTDTNGIYISSSDAAKRTGYSQDYIGQLARSGAVIAKKIGRKWFIEQDALEQHKSHNDNLLAAVQANSVGMKSDKIADIEGKTGAVSQVKIQRIPTITYKHDDGSLVPGSVRGGSEERHQAEVYSMPLEVSQNQVERRDLRSRPVYSQKRKMETLLGDESSSREVFIPVEETMSTAPSILSRAVLTLMFSISLFSIVASLSAPEVFHKYIIQTLNSLSIPHSSDYLESTDFGKEALHMTSAIITYRK